LVAGTALATGIGTRVSGGPRARPIGNRDRDEHVGGVDPERGARAGQMVGHGSRGVSGIPEATRSTVILVPG
jgi:hypothetical protein